MKNLMIPGLALAAMLTTSHAATVLVDGSTRNGGFETNTGTTYDVMDNWFNTGTGTETTAIRSATANSGIASAIVSAGSAPAVSTGHTITLGDSFDLSFSHRVFDATARPIIWTLFYFTNEFAPGFDETISEASISPLFTGTVNATSTTYTQSVIPTTAQMGAADPALGSTLYLRFSRPAAGGFPVVDDVNLSVVPEPSVALLGGLGLLGLLRRRR